LTAPRRVDAVVLAAGLSARFGGDKLLHPLAGKPLGAHIATTLAGLPLAARFAICPLDATARRELFQRHGFEIVDNPYPERGMGTSLALGARHALETGADAMLVCLADMPYVTAEHLMAMMGVSARVVATESEGVRSPPAVFSREVLPELAALTGNHGARALLESAATITADPSLVRDFDTPGDFA
jgi:molybdenum cofactor cytidylyltransferase